MRAFFVQHKIFLIALVLALEIITIIPVFYGYTIATAETYFNGVSNLAPGDFSLYLSYFEQVKQGHWFFEDLYTGEWQSANLFNPFFLLFGLVGKVFHLSNIATFHISRAIMIPIFLAVLMIFLRLFFSDRKKLYLAAIITALGSGIGAWLAPFFGSHSYINHISGYYHWPMDLWVPEFNVFLTLHRNPLYVASLTLILLIFLLFVKSIIEQKILWSVLAGVSGLFLFLIHPYHIPTIYAVAIVWVIVTILRKQANLAQTLMHFGILVFFSVPAVIYQVTLLLTDPIMHQRYYNTGGPPTVWWLTIISYGFLLIFALPEIRRFLKALFTKTPLTPAGQWLSFCLIWFIVGILLVYSPFFEHTRRLTEGLQIPLVIFTTIFLFRQTKTFWYKKFEKIADTRIILTIAFIFIFGTSTIYAIAQDFNLYTTKHPKVYIPIQTYDGMQWIKKQTTNNDVILTDLLIGNLLPGIAGRHVYIGHTSETALYRLKERWLFAFFAQNRSENFELKFLKDNRITYIFYTPDLKKSGTWRPENKTYLSKVFENDRAAIYVVR